MTLSRVGDGENFWKKCCATHSHLQSHIDRGGGGQEKGPGGTSQDPERSSFQSKHVLTSSSKEQRNIRFVAREKTSGADQGDPTKGVGSSPGPGGCTNEMLRVCLDDGELFQLLYLAAQDFADGSAPAEVCQALTRATMTALRKTDGGVRGNATGTSFRRLVAKSLARQFGQEVERVCSPFQFALSTRAGVDCVGHAVRIATDPGASVLSIDGIGAYDHVLRSAMLGKLLEEENLRGLLPFVRMVYSQPSRYHWEDEDGCRKEICQHEGGEQGDPLMPLLFCLAIHNVLVEVRSQLLPGEHLFAFLDDICALTKPERTRDVYDLLAHNLFQYSGIMRAKLGRGIEQEKFPSAWRECVEPSKYWGHQWQFGFSGVRHRGAIGQELWRAIPSVPDLQCAWQLLLQCAGPRCHHFLRTVPPTQSRVYAEGHDRGMQEVMARLLGGLPGESQQNEVAQDVATLPCVGGLGLRSASRTGVVQTHCP